MNTHYLAGQVRAFVKSSAFRNHVTLRNEPDLLGTAGTLIKNLDFFEGKGGLSIHADNYCLADCGAFLHAHRTRPSHCAMTMMTFRTDTPSLSGVVDAFHEKVSDPPGNLANGAVYVLSAQMLEKLRDKFHTGRDFSTQVLHRFVGQIYTYETAEVFLDVGTPVACLRAISI